MQSDYIHQMFSVEGQVIVITGGGGILCGTMARELAKAGAKIAVLDIQLPAAQKVVADITAAGGEAIAIETDVLSKESLQQSAEQVLARYGRVDALINGAGGNKKQATTAPDLSFFDLPQDAFQCVFNLNFLGMLLASQVYGKLLCEQGEGAILNIASVNAFRALTKIPAYSAAKAAVKNFTEWMAVHVAQEYSPNVRVNAIAPGFFLTEQNRFLLTDEKTGERTLRGQTIINHTPMGRYGEPEELMSTVIWLLAPASRFVHGVTVAVDGGFCIFSGV
ncbi:MAG: SDR family oxidoreductase [Chloroflexi bacterium]|nr:SDR family oxidoreductase [Chloroflexota bacterium]